ncbi:hypothetical protein PHLCEN_2v1349 [Hermanssonia centrifuga]|uniref:Copper homeostasis protein cutC homolog n=1 Tax=Hermanssonia centrifuga TaxID=98765 RepID=A0A2R6S3H5_9APHY|nr:hypothetical protein PHLCEN_2v1349 [Hermanssonia centrifuga]
MVMIRPRTGDFLYTPDEIIVMLEDIRSFKEAGVDGLVFGALTKDGRVDIRTTSRLANEARPLQVCFHRAFDMTRNPLEALQDLQSIEGITRILTSGHGKTAPSSLPVLISLLRGSCSENHPPLTILPGSGINPNTVGSLVKALTPHGLREIHLSAGGWVPGEMEYKKDGMGMGIGGEGEWGIWRTSEEAVRWVRRIVDETIQ